MIKEILFSNIFFIDMAAVKGWLPVRRAEKIDMTLLDSKLVIADALWQAGKPVRQMKMGWPSRNKVKEIPQVDISKDRVEHFSC